MNEAEGKIELVNAVLYHWYSLYLKLYNHVEKQLLTWTVMSSTFIFWKHFSCGINTWASYINDYLESQEPVRQVDIWNPSSATKKHNVQLKLREEARALNTQNLL